MSERIAVVSVVHGVELSLHGVTITFPVGAIPRVRLDVGTPPTADSAPIAEPDRFGRWDTLAQQRAYLRRFLADQADA